MYKDQKTNLLILLCFILSFSTFEAMAGITRAKESCDEGYELKRIKVKGLLRKKKVCLPKSEVSLNKNGVNVASRIAPTSVTCKNRRSNPVKTYINDKHVGYTCYPGNSKASISCKKGYSPAKKDCVSRKESWERFNEIRSRARDVKYSCSPGKKLAENVKGDRVLVTCSF